MALSRNFYSGNKKVKVYYEMGKDYSFITMNDVQTQVDLPSGFKSWRMDKQKDFLESFANDIDDISPYLPKLALAGVNKIGIDWNKLSPDLLNAGALDAYDPNTGEIANLMLIHNQKISIHILKDILVSILSGQLCCMRYIIQ